MVYSGKREINNIMIIIRKAKIKDVPQVAKLGADLLRLHAKFDKYFIPIKNIEKFYNKFFKASVYSSESLLLAAEKDKKIVGYMLAVIRKRESVYKLQKVGNINDGYIIPPYRRQGITSEFIKKSFQWFKIKKIKNVELQVHIKNPIGRAAWSKYGFETYVEQRRLKIK